MLRTIPGIATARSPFRALPLLLVVVAGCGGGGEYNFSREYHPLSEERPYLERAVRGASYEDVKRDPADYRSSMLDWFGVVTSVEMDGATARVHMTHRVHQDRHLCEDERDSSCRVTVSDRQSGPFTATLTIRSDDIDGPDRLWTGSLLRVYGSPTGDFDDEGGPVVGVEYYRHWPRGKYVTTGASTSMRR